MNILVKNKSERITISAPNHYGASFTLGVYNQDNSTWVQNGIPMTESVEPFTIDETTIDGDFTKGTKEITVADGTNITPGDVREIKNYIYGVASVDGNNITLAKELKEGITTGDTCNRVGNMGLFYADVTIDTSGDYLIQAKDTVYGAKTTDSIKVVDKDINTMANEIKQLEYAILGN
jgi:hypothetical protein